jgi:TonB-linked SusC/RagA family outer membrane protein
MSHMRSEDARSIPQKQPVFLFLLILLLTTSGLLHAQEIKTVTGVVLDDSGKPVSNTSILIKGSKQAVATDSLGKFTIKVKKGDVLQITHVSFSPRRITYDNQGTLRIALQREDASLADVVVTGYQTVKKKMFSGSSTTLSAKELERAGQSDITKMLEGQFAGVSVQNVSGTFGAAPKLRIRGATSLSGDNKPLWVIDGIIVEDVVNISNEALTTGDMNTLLGSSVAGVNPADIQDITILRDAAATALYGARAMNGVVVVTTKKGRSNSSGTPIINYTGNYSMYIKPRYEDFDILNSADQMGVLVEEMNKGFFQMPGVISGGNGGVLYKMYSLIDSHDSTSDRYGVRNGDAGKAAFLSHYANANTNWFDIIFKNSFIQEHSISISSGTEKFQTYASTSYLKDNGQTIGNNVEKFTGNLRTNFRVGNKVKGELLATGSVRNQRAPGTQNQQSEPVYGTYLRGFDINPYNYALNTSRMLTAYDEDGKLEYFTQNYAPFNIINELNTNYMKMQVLDLKMQGGLAYKIIPQLEYSINGSYRFVKSESQTHILENSNMAQAYREAKTAISIGSNQYLYNNPDNPNDPPVIVLPSGGFYNIQANNLKYLYFRHSLDYNQNFGADHTVTAFASMEARSTERQYEFFDGVGYQYDNGGLVSPYYMYFKQAAEQGRAYFGMLPGKDRFLAYMMTATYGYKNKYIFTPTFRYDGSNKMGQSKVARWLPTWNLAGSWNIHEEPFWISNNVLTSATLRSSYGLTGNIGSATNSAATYYNMIARRPYINDQETLTFISDLENAQLTWEKSKDLDVGIDLGFMNNRLTLRTDYYKRSIQDLIGDIKTSGIGGQFTKKGNYGTMQASGIEFTLDARMIKTKDFAWSSRFNIAHNTNKITRLETDPLIWTVVSGNGGAVKGHPSRGLFSVPFAGLDHYHGYPTFIGTGKGSPVTTYVALQDDDLSNLKYEGPADPTLTGGFYNQISYKGFTLAGLIKFSTGNVLRLRPTISAGYSDMQAMTKDVLNRWVMPGDETRTSIPAIFDPVSSAQIVDNTGAQVQAVYPYNLYNYSTERIVDGKYLKLANLSFGYQLPQKWCSLLSMTNASVTAVANNILTIYADKRLNGQDPEFYNSGGVALPTSKQVTVSLKVGF